MLRARLFGGLSLGIGERAVPEIHGVKPRSLLAYLLMNPGSHPRARLAGRFWPDVLDTSARGSLRSALWSVRAALEAAGGGGHLRADRTAVALDPGPGAWIDVREFDALLRAGDRASLERAVLLAAEPLLPDIPDEWALEAQDHHRDRMVEVLSALSRRAAGEGDGARAVAYAREALAHDRLRESSHRALMERLAAAGDGAGALAAYRRCRDVLATGLGMAPSAPTRALAEEIRAGQVAGGVAPAAPVPAPARPGPPEAQPPMVGRDDELARLRDAWDAVAAGGGVVLVEGAAGVGKSRLVAEVRAHAAATGARVAVGHALDIDERPPFGPWADALRQVVRGAPAPPVSAAWPEDLARLCPAVEVAWGRRPGPDAHEPTLGRARLFEAVAEGLEWGAGSAPLLLVLEDLHWADPSSLALLAHVGPLVRRTRVLVVATAREGADAEGLPRAVDALERRGGLVARIALAPLGDDEVMAIARSASPGLDAAAVEQVAATAGGNPLLAGHAARALAAGGDPAEGLRAMVRGPMAGLPPPARELVGAAAAAGRALTLSEAIAVTGGDRLDEAVAEAVGCGLLRSSAAGSVEFTHDLVRRACYGELPSGRRRAAHARLAEIIAAAPGRPASEVAHHLRGAGALDRARVYLMSAASSARALGALDQAAAFLAEAAASAAAAEMPAAEAEAWLALAEIEAWRGDRAATEEAFGHARARMVEAGEVTGLASALAERARWFRTTTCYPEEAIRSSREALALVEGAGLDAPETRVLALAGIAWGEAVAGDPAVVDGVLRELEALVGGDDDPVLRSEMLISQAFALMRSGRGEEAEARFAEAAVIAERARRPAHALDARIGQAATAAALGRIADVPEILAATPDPSRAGPGLSCQRWAGIAYALARMGRADEALVAAHEGLEVARRFANVELEAVAHADIGVTLLAAGRPVEAGEALERALGVEGARVPRAALRLTLAEAAVAAGDLDAATAHLDRFPFEPVRPGDDPPGLIPRLDRVQGLLLLAQGEHAAGIRRLEAAEERWRGVVDAASSGPVGDTMAAVMIDLGRPPVAGLSDPAADLARVRREVREATAGARVAPGAG